MGAVARGAGLKTGYTAVSEWSAAHLKPYILFPFLGLLAFVMGYPIFMVVYGSFKGGPPGTDAPFSLDGYVSAWSSWWTIKALIITFALAVPRVLLGAALAILVAWILTRTNTPLRGLFEQLIWFKIFLPTLPLLMAWLFIGAGRTGLANRFLMNTFNLSSPPLDLRSYWGVVFLSVMTMSLIFYIYISPAFKNMDASLEESARIAGASSLTTLWRITVPIMMPAILGITFLMFLAVVGSFELELFLLSNRGIYVFTTFIWHLMGVIPADYPGAMALATVFILLTTAIIFLNFKILGGRQYTTITGRGFMARTIELGPWKWVTFSFMALLLLVGFLLPMAVLILGTFITKWGVLESGLTLYHWKEALTETIIIRSIKNTLILATGVATVGMVFHGLLSYIYLRTRLKGRNMIEALTWVPRMAPGIVAAVGIMWAVLGGIPGIKVLYGSLILMAIVIIIEGTPAAMRLMNGGMVQLGAELEESARVSGASWLRTVRKVVVPLLIPTLLNYWLLKFLVATRALILVLFIYVPASKVLSIDIFERMIGGSEMEQAAVLGLLLTAICMIAATLARITARKVRGQMGVM